MWQCRRAIGCRKGLYPLPTYFWRAHSRLIAHWCGSRQALLLLCLQGWHHPVRAQCRQATNLSFLLCPPVVARVILPVVTRMTLPVVTWMTLNLVGEYVYYGFTGLANDS